MSVVAYLVRRNTKCTHVRRVVWDLNQSRRIHQLSRDPGDTTRVSDRTTPSPRPINSFAGLQPSRVEFIPEHLLESKEERFPVSRISSQTPKSPDCTTRRFLEIRFFIWTRHTPWEKPSTLSTDGSQGVSEFRPTWRTHQIEPVGRVLPPEKTRPPKVLVTRNTATESSVSVGPTRYSRLRGDPRQIESPRGGPGR